MARVRKAADGVQEVPIAQIDEPSLAMRETMDEEALYGLADSIKAMGVLLPIILKPKGDRYEIEDGHRRFLASRMAQLETIPARVRTDGSVSSEAVKCHANWNREDISPAEEAKYLATVLERDCGGDVDKLSGMIRQRREYIESRLLLLRGDPEVFQALYERKISLAVARELNRFEDQGYRRMYLDAALRGGATARLVQEWRAAAAGLTPIAAPDSGDGTNQHTATPAPVMEMKCICCGQHERPYDLEFLYLCKTGCRQLVDRLLARATGDNRNDT